MNETEESRERNRPTSFTRVRDETEGGSTGKYRDGVVEVDRQGCSLGGGHVT